MSDTQWMAGKSTATSSIFVKSKKPKKKTTSQLKKQLDKIFSQWVRQRDGHTCVTCGKKMLPTESQNGHYISRGALATRYDERNCNCQCVGCNVFRNGNMAAYTIFLQNKYGHGIVEELYRESKKIVKYFPYEAEIERYESLLETGDKKFDTE